MTFKEWKKWPHLNDKYTKVPKCNSEFPLFKKGIKSNKRNYPKNGGFSFGDFKIAHHVTVYCRMNVELINV